MKKIFCNRVFRFVRFRYKYSLTSVISRFTAVYICLVKRIKDCFQFPKPVPEGWPVPPGINCVGLRPDGGEEGSRMFYFQGSDCENNLRGWGRWVRKERRKLTIFRGHSGGKHLGRWLLPGVGGGRGRVFQGGEELAETKPPENPLFLGARSCKQWLANEVPETT